MKKRTRENTGHLSDILEANKNRRKMNQPQLVPKSNLKTSANYKAQRYTPPDHLESSDDNAEIMSTVNDGAADPNRAELRKSVVQSGDR